MKKEYEKPEVEVISLVTEEAITGDGEDILDGEMGTSGSIF